MSPAAYTLAIFLCGSAFGAFVMAALHGFGVIW